MHDQGDGPNSIQKRGSVAETQKKPSMEDGWREANNDLRYNRSRAEANSGRPKEVGQGGQAKDQKTQTGAEIVSEFIVGVVRQLICIPCTILGRSASGDAFVWQNALAVF